MRKDCLGRDFSFIPLNPNNMKVKVEEKLLKIISSFVGQELKYGELKDIKVNNRSVLVLELTFSDEGFFRTMVLALDKNLTVSLYSPIAEELIK